MELAYEVLIFAIAHDGANVTRNHESLHSIARCTHECSNRWRDQDVRSKHREISKPFPLRLPDGHGIRRSRRFKTDSKKDYFAGGICTGEFERFRGGINHPHISAAGLHVE